MKPITVDNIQTLIHPVFAMGVRDGVIRQNPASGVTYSPVNGDTVVVSYMEVVNGKITLPDRPGLGLIKL